MAFLINYLKGTRSELRHVNWPTRQDAVAFTILVVVVSLLIGAYLGALDFVFNLVLKAVILR